MSNYLASCRTDHLFLLIGTNPLPNYVAAKLLAGPETHVYLVHSDETGDLANRLVGTLKLPDGKWSKVYKENANCLANTGRIKRLLKMLEWPGPPREITGYMELSAFRDRRVLPDPIEIKPCDTVLPSREEGGGWKRGRKN